MEHISRRGLLGTAAAVASTTLANETPSAKVRIGLIGCPPISAAALDRFGIGVAYVWDPDRSRADAFAATSSARTADRPEGMKVDGVVISGAHAFQPKLVASYLNSRVAVWIDGALAPSGKAAEDLSSASERSGAPLMAATKEEFLPLTASLRESAKVLAPLTAAMLAVGAPKPAGRWSGIEAVNLTCAIFGTDVSHVARIAVAPDSVNFTVAIRSSGLHVIAQGLPLSAGLPWARLYGTDMIDRAHVGDAETDWAIYTLAMQQMFRSRKAPQSLDYQLAKTKFYLASCRSATHADGRELAVADLPSDWTVT